MKTIDHEKQECRIIDLETVILDMLAKKKEQNDTVEKQARRIEELETGIEEVMAMVAGVMEMVATR
jgi:hypothetical protein